MTFIRFLLIGLVVGVVDLIPGVSGGTLAFAFGIWERIIAAIMGLLSVIRLLIAFRIKDCWASCKSIDWELLVPLGLGILLAIFAGASIIGSLLDTHPTYLRAFFLGLFLGVLSLPIRAVRKWNISLILLFLAGAIFAFFVAGIPQQTAQAPPLLVIFLIGGITICATILPGLSGSFLLMTFGVYEVLIDSVRDRNFLVCGVFTLGAIAGIFSFSSFLKLLLFKYREVVLAILLGLMIGGARILWPWLGHDRRLLPPEDIFVTSVWLFGGMCVAIMMRQIVIRAELAEGDKGFNVRD